MNDIDLTQLIYDYTTSPDKFWEVGGKGGLSQANKIKAFMKELASLVSIQVNKHFSSHKTPFFVMGCGGSGSTWFGEMLGSIPGFAYSNEVYLPSEIIKEYRQTNNEVVKMFIVTCMAFPAMVKYKRFDMDFDFVNSARGIDVLDICRSIWPNGHYMFLARDPRDQILCLTYRKQKYREFAFPGISDEEYLVKNSQDIVGAMHFYVNNKSSFRLVHYEDLMNDAFSVLRKICVDYGIVVDDEKLRDIVFQNNAENMRSAKIEKHGNLSDETSNWKTLLSERDKRIIQPIIQPALEVFEYESNSNW